MLQLRLFEAFDIELNYMIVYKESLRAAPLSENLIKEIEKLGLSTEFVWTKNSLAHSVDLSTLEPAKTFMGLGQKMQIEIQKANEILSKWKAQLLPTSMNPAQQGMHIHIPFANNTDFERLQTAIRLLMPMLPALAASSPITRDGKFNGVMNNQLRSYLRSKTIPEIHLSDKEYKSVEIRILDLQETPQVDIAVAALLVETLKNLVMERWASFQEQKDFNPQDLHSIFFSTVRNGEEAVVDNQEYLKCFGLMNFNSISASDFWYVIMEQVFATSSSDIEFTEPLSRMLSSGTLAKRIIKAAGDNPDRSAIKQVYNQLARSLELGKIFIV